MKVAIPPITTTDFTKGKEYEILKDYGNRFVTKNDHNEIVCCAIENSEFINNKNFQIKEK